MIFRDNASRYEPCFFHSRQSAKSRDLCFPSDFSHFRSEYRIDSAPLIELCIEETELLAKDHIDMLQSRMRFQRSSRVLDVSHFFFFCIIYAVIPPGLTKNRTYWWTALSYFTTRMYTGLHSASDFRFTSRANQIWYLSCRCRNTFLPAIDPRAHE